MSDTEGTGNQRATPVDSVEIRVSAPWKMRLTDELRAWLGYNIAMSLAAPIGYLLTVSIMSAIFRVSVEGLFGSVTGLGPANPGGMFTLVFVMVVSTIPSLFVLFWQIHWNVNYFCRQLNEG